jgi:hypothetical protein
MLPYLFTELMCVHLWGLNDHDIVFNLIGSICDTKGLFTVVMGMELQLMPDSINLFSQAWVNKMPFFTDTLPEGLVSALVLEPLIVSCDTRSSEKGTHSKTCTERNVRWPASQFVHQLQLQLFMGAQYH